VSRSGIAPIVTACVAKPHVLSARTHYRSPRNFLGGPGSLNLKSPDHGVTAGFARGSFTAVMGPSGSGKSTFLHCAAGLDRPTSGRVLLAGQDIGALREPKLTTVRRQHVGFVFQSGEIGDHPLSTNGFEPLS